MRTQLNLLVFLGISLCVNPFSNSFADEIGEKARQLVENHNKAVIRLKAVMQASMMMGGQSAGAQEVKSQLLGTVIDASGLVVISLSKIDLENSMGGMRRRRGGKHKIEIKTELTSLKIVHPDGKEIAAKVVLRDKDLDIAVVVPEEKQDKPFSFIDLSHSATPELMTKAFILSRLGKAAKQTPYINTLRINAIVKKPRTFYISEGITYLGTPVFSLKGKIFGVTLMRNTSGGTPLYIVLPPDEILEIAKQAKDVMNQATTAEASKESASEENKEEK